MESDPRVFHDLTVKLWKAIVDFNKDIRDLRKKIGEFRIGLFKAFYRRRLKSIEAKFLELNSRIFYMEDLETGDFRSDSLWYSLYNKQFTELTEEEKKILIPNEERLTREEVNVYVKKFMHYWRMEPPPQMKPHIIKAIRKAEKNLTFLDNRIVTKFSDINQLTAIKISVISMIIAVSSILIGIFT